MSVAAVAWALEQPIKPQPKMVLAAIAWHADAEGVCWPKQEQVAKTCGIGVRMVKKHIQFLIAGGYLFATRRGHRGNLYSLPVKGNSSSPIEPERGTLVPLVTGTTVPLSDSNGNSDSPLRNSLRGTSVQSKGNSSSPDAAPLRSPLTTPLLSPRPNRHEPSGGGISRTPARARESPAWLKRLSTGAWARLTPLHIAELEAQAARLGLDIAAESLACEDYWKGHRKEIKSPFTALRNWLDKAAEIKRERNGNGRANSQAGDSDTGADDGGFGGWAEVIANRGRRPA